MPADDAPTRAWSHPPSGQARSIPNEIGEVLLVRKRNSSIFIQPGGKAEQGEEPLVTLDRELDEELGVRLIPASVRLLGEFEAMAVNEPDCIVRAKAFVCAVTGTPEAQAEIEELAWIKPEGPYAIPVAPLSSEKILRAYLAIWGEQNR